MVENKAGDSSVVRAWYAQLADASKTPGLVQHLVRRTGELLPRFAAYYDRLRALPRRVRRALGRCRGLSLARVALLLALCSGPLHAATIFVDETTCRLADAITAAETDTATGGCPAGSGADLVVLDADVTLGAALPTINSEVRIEAGQAAVIDGGGSTACLSIVQGVVTLDGLTVRNCVAPNFVGGAVTNYGTTTILNCTLSGNSATGFPGGGGVRNEGTLTIVGSTISGNTAVWDGGCIFNNGSLTISQSILSGNTTAGSGGGLYNYSYNGAATFTDSVISGNAASKGGGISTGSFWYGDRRPLDIRTSTISGNTASVGGGIASYEYGTVLLTESTLSGNTATARGGAVYTNPGFLNELTLTSSTISGNSAGEEGGGIFARGTEDYGYSTLALAHVLISGNTAPLAPEMSFEPSIDVFADNFNLVGYDGDDRSEGFTPGATDIVPAQGVLLDDILAPLADNGGPTQTHALVSGSPAVDAIPTSDPSCLGATDQRGFPRPVGAGCDIGSFELGSRLPVGGSVTGILPRVVSCKNVTAGGTARERSEDSTWDCEALGLAVQPGDTVQSSGRGIVDATDAHVGGAVVGMTPTSVFCQNLSTGSKVQTPTSATAWDCEALGLVVEAGDRVHTGALGTVDSPP